MPNPNTLRGRDRGLILLMTFTLAACGGSVSGGGGGETVDPGALASTIPVTRQACTPFGDPPRQLLALNDGLFNPSCAPGGERLPRFTDGEGTVRDACLFEPPQASADAPLPLVVFVHPSAAGTDISLAASNIRSQLATADLTGDPERPGFIMLSPYGRVTSRFYPFPDNNFVPGWDNWYRQMLPGEASRTVNGQPFPLNVDAQTLDHYLEAVLATGKVDPARIYLMGWSNGAAMGLLYALNRPEIAAAAVYSSPNPFEAFNDPCPQTPVSGTPVNDTEIQVLNPDLPILHVHNDCDIAGICPNGLFLRDSVRAFGGAFDNVLVDTALQPASECLAICGTDPTARMDGVVDLEATITSLPGYSLGVLNHLRWPVNQTTAMFDFLRTHPQ
jgi:predicted esterase